MENRRNNLFVAFALWAGAWALISFFDYWAYKLQFAVADFSDGFVPVSIEEFPLIEAVLVVLIAARAWKAPVMSLFLAFVALEFVWLVLDFTASSGYFLMCTSNVCPEKWSYDFDFNSITLRGAGYTAMSVLVLAKRLLGGQEKSAGSGNPLTYAAQLFAGATARLTAWLQIDAPGIKTLWKKWAALPLWPSGRLLANAVGPLWVPYFGFAAAMLVASQIVQIFTPFLQSDAPFSLAGPEWGLVTLGYIITLFSMLAASWTAGRMTVELGWNVSFVATAVALLLVNFWEVNLLVTGVGTYSPSSPDFYMLLLQAVGQPTVLCLGYWQGYRREMRRRRTAGLAI